MSQTGLPDTSTPGRPDTPARPTWHGPTLSRLTTSDGTHGGPDNEMQETEQSRITPS